MEKNYKSALTLLETCRRRAGESALKSPPPPGKKGNPVGLTGMGDNLRLLGHLDADLDRLAVVHLAGTKGKGSTCALTTLFLRAYGERTGFPCKIGLYTGPHLITVRECVRINFEPISEELFAKYFFEVWDKLSDDALKYPNKLRPGFLQILTLVSFHAFFREHVDVAIFETNNGGTHDATNIAKPNVVGITSLGLDHVQALGSKIEDIAWHKSGIFKPGIPAFSSIQEPVAAAVLQNRASEKDVQLTFVDVDDTFLAKELPKIQRQNACLARALANEFLRQKAPEENGLIPQDIIRGVELFSSWPGRLQRNIDGKFQWFLDIAHNEMSLSVVGEWFAKSMELQSKIPRILIFGHNSRRDLVALVRSIAKPLQDNDMQIQHVIFCKLDQSRAFHHFDLEVSDDMLKVCAETWKSIDSTAQISLEPTIEGALDLAKRIGGEQGMQTLVTGSTRLVGPALHFLGLSTSY